MEGAAWEFADTERFIKAGEDLFGPYVWGRYDLLVLPPSFPYGGMVRLASLGLRVLLKQTSHRIDRAGHTA